MNILSTLTLSKKINDTIKCSVVPVLLTTLKTKSLFNYISKFITIPETYIPLLKSIEENIKTNNLGMASLTVEYNNSNSNSNINSIINNKQYKSLKTKSSKTKSSKTKSSKTKLSKTKSSKTKASKTKSLKVYNDNMKIISNIIKDHY